MLSFNHWYWMVRGSALYALQHYAHAVAAYDRALELQPNSYQAWAARGLALKELNQEEEAIASFFRSLEINPTYYKAASWLHIFLMPEATKAKLFEAEPRPKLQEQLECALALQERAIQIAPSSHNWSTYAALLDAMGQTEEALNSYNQAIQLDPNNALAWSSRGRLLGKLQRYEEALDCFNRVLQTDSEAGSAWKQRGDLLEKLQRHEEAVAAYQKAAQLEEKLIPQRMHIVSKNHKEFTETVAYEELGQLLEKAGQCEEALAAYQKARDTKTNLHPAQDLSWLYQANLLQKLERYEDLFALSLEWLEVAEGGQEDYLPWLYQGNALKQLKQYEKAITAYDHCIEHNLQHPDAWIERGDALYELQRWQEALASYDNVIAINPTHEAALSKREQVLQQLRQ